MDILKELSDIQCLIGQIDRVNKHIEGGIATIPEPELMKIISKQERRLAVVTHLMKYSLQKTQAMADSGYRTEILQRRKEKQEESQAQILFSQGLSAHEIMESGGPITRTVLERWIEETEGGES